MFEFILMLFFAREIELTPVPVVIYPSIAGHEILLEQPIGALTSGANLKVDVTEMLEDRDSKHIDEVRQNVASVFQDNSVRANLMGGGGSFELSFSGCTSIGGSTVMIVLTPDSDSLPTNVEFDKLVIHTDIKLYNVKLLWRNYN